MGTRQYVIRKIVQALITLAAILVFNFFLFRVWSPGDPISFLTRGQGANISLEERAALIHEYGLDESTWGQFTEYLKDTVTGKLGVSSFYQGESVTSVSRRFLPATLLLVGISTTISMVVGIWLGIRSGWRRGGSFDRSSMFSRLVLYSMPEFWLGMLLLLLFSTTWGGSRSAAGSRRREQHGPVRIRRGCRRTSVPAGLTLDPRIPRRVLPADEIVVARCPG